MIALLALRARRIAVNADIDCIVVFTDCECEEMTPDRAPEVPVLWISTKKGEHKNIQFGEVVDFDQAD